MIKREIQSELENLKSEYPIITILGPRQAGKTTLAKMTFPDYMYCNLESPDTRAFAQNDPQAFLQKYNKNVIFDEVQRVPQLLSYIQVLVDEEKSKGRFILTGSHQLELSASVSQSLAGRTALLNLLPLSIRELTQHGITFSSKEDYLFKGFLPRIYDDNLQPTRAYRSYYHTYVERDLRQLIQLKDLSSFEKFIKLLAGRVGSELNLHSLAGDVGVSSTTLKSWVSVLEASFIIFQLRPYFENFGKRVIKSPKLYFTDVGLLTYLLGIETTNQLSRDPLQGALFENMVVIEALKTRLNKGLDGNLYFFRANNGLVVDLIYKEGPNLVPIEIKSSMTFNQSFLGNIQRFRDLVKNVERSVVIYSGEGKQLGKNQSVMNFRDTYRVMSSPI